MKVLVLDDLNKGNFIQSLGIAERLTATPDIFQVELRGPSYFIPQRKGKYKIAGKIIGFFLRMTGGKPLPLLLKIFLKDRKNIWLKRFDVVISTGSYLAPVNALISKMSGAFSVCILTPEGIPLRLFDLLIVPRHDLLRHPGLRRMKNLFTTVGAPNRISGRLLAEWSGKLAEKINVPADKRKIGVVIGGDDQNYYIDTVWAGKLPGLLRSITEKGNTVCFLTTSRRTRKNTVLCLKNLTDNDPLFLYREFPGITTGSLYFGILALSDIILVTEDSVSMISEACSTGKPVFVLGVGRRKKHNVFDETIRFLVEKKHCVYVPVDQFALLPDIIKKTENVKFEILKEADVCAAVIKEKILSNNRIIRNGRNVHFVDS